MASSAKYVFNFLFLSRSWQNLIPVQFRCNVRRSMFKILILLRGATLFQLMMYLWIMFWELSVLTVFGATNLCTSVHLLSVATVPESWICRGVTFEVI